MLDHLVQKPDERDEIGTARPPVHEAGKPRGVAPWIERADVCGSAVAHDRDQPLDRLQDARDVAERQRRSAETYDLAVVAPIEPPHDLNRIGGRIWIVEPCVKPV